ncbi:glycosyltransferase family 2 protein [Formosa sp. S-31]|uniref:glycosyltransferase family 2 protein n=1 Tax=Formosa sp. S-31 TaxID=2790949 RepID=UPI003EBEACB9
MKLAIVILNWNGKALLQQFSPSVISHSPEADIYVIDNASTDDSVFFLKTEFPDVKIIINSENGGYAKGYNEGLKHVDADIYCLLNNDIEVSPNWLQPIIETFKTQPNTAVIQPKILDFKNREYFEYAGAAGGFIDKYGYPFCRGRIFDTLEKDLGQYNAEEDIFWATGACLFIRSSVFKSLQGFDEHFFAHMEEIDLCWRAKNLNHTIKCVPASTVYHVGGATLQSSNPQKTYLNFRNSLYTLVKNASGNIFGIIFMRLLLDGLAAVKFLIALKPFHIVSILKAHFKFYLHLPRLLKQRKTTLKTKNYFTVRSIVWAYFVKKNKNFNQL